MATTIQVDVSLLNELKCMKLFERESYAEVIRDLIENSKELNEQTQKEVELSRAQIKEGKYYNLDEVKKQLNLQ
ncbi:MAG: hypothetical protein MSIBF_02130 [Candidatus Altiarchaeales archaeon IMC4]|nr:MAG: hypothetical protein MSIBF_02130 [Candidatus Altiarchaeales archaeon IMC4]